MLRVILPKDEDASSRPNDFLFVLVFSFLLDYNTLWTLKERLRSLKSLQFLFVRNCVLHSLFLRKWWRGWGTGGAGFPVFRTFKIASSTFLILGWPNCRGGFSIHFGLREIHHFESFHRLSILNFVIIKECSLPFFTFHFFYCIWMSSFIWFAKFKNYFFVLGFYIRWIFSTPLYFFWQNGLGDLFHYKGSHITTCLTLQPHSWFLLYSCLLESTTMALCNS